MVRNRRFNARYVARYVARYLARSMALCYAAFTLLVFTLNQPLQAETWSDTSGQFKIDAEFQGVSGTSVVLKKADGSNLTVPIAKLSPASRARAKELFNQQKADREPSGSSSTVQDASANIASGTDASSLSVTPPVPAPVDPMPAFPDGASLQATVDFIADQLIAGHPEVMWHMFPNEIRDAIDDENIRVKAGKFMREQASAGQQSEEAMNQAIELLIAKKEFVLNSQLMTQVPPHLIPIVHQGYDPAVGLVYELMQFSKSFENIQQHTISDLLDQHGPRIGGHLKSLIALAPPEMVQSIRGSIVASETDETNGTVTSVGPGGKEQVLEFSRYNDRWLPKKLAGQWADQKDDLEATLTARMEEAGEQNAANLMMAAMFTGMLKSIMQPLSDAETQEEFDAALMKATEAAGRMAPGAAN